MAARKTRGCCSRAPWSFKYASSITYKIEKKEVRLSVHFSNIIMFQLCSHHGESSAFKKRVDRNPENLISLANCLSGTTHTCFAWWLGCKLSINQPVCFATENFERRMLQFSTASSLATPKTLLTAAAIES